jgi:cell division protein FtsN
VVVDGAAADSDGSAVADGAAPVAEGAAADQPVAVAEEASPSSFGKRPRSAPVVVDASTEPAAEGAATGHVSVAPLDGGSAPAAAEPATAQAAPAAAPAASGGIRFPFVQAASFGTEENAKAAADRLNAGGVQALVSRTTTASGGNVKWRVLAGPLGSAAEQAAVLEKVKGLGFRDAYLVRG